MESKRLFEERRRSNCHSTCAEIEIRETCRGSRSRGATIDVSLGGYYVATIFPLPLGATIDSTLWTAGGAIEGHGSVQTCHPGVGMSIKFIDLAEEAIQRLDDYLHCSLSTLTEERV
jgi:hypothetical protein